MSHYIIAIDQSTSATKALLFDEQLHVQAQTSVAHRQYYPQPGWVEHDAEEIYQNLVSAVRQLIRDAVTDTTYSLAITNQRETVVVWNRHTGKPIANAVVWQDTRGAEVCRELEHQVNTARKIQAKTGLLVDPSFSATAVQWLLEYVDGARAAADQGDLLMGTIDTWLVWKLTGGKTFATDTTNASRTMLFDITTLDWDDELLNLFGIPRPMMAEVRTSDALYGETTVEGVFASPVQIAGVIGDSQGALVGQMCYTEGSCKVTYGTGSSVMLNIGEQPKKAPRGLVTSVGFSALGKTCYGFEGNIYSTGATLKWMADQLRLVEHPREMEAAATSVEDNGGVYIVPAFSGLGAPWWRSDVKAAIFGMTFATTRAHILRAALESIGYQVKDLLNAMKRSTNIRLRDICADGGPTKNQFLMQFQADLLGVSVICTEVEDASAMGAVVMNGFARKVWTSFDEVKAFRRVKCIYDQQGRLAVIHEYTGWLNAVNQLLKQ